MREGGRGELRGNLLNFASSSLLTEGFTVQHVEQKMIGAAI